MNSSALWLLAAAFLLAGLDWWSVHRSNKSLEYVCKPATALLMLLAALAIDPADDAARGWLIAALALCVIGDVFLMLPQDAFVAGLASFAVAQVLFTVSFLVREVSGARLLIGLLLVAAGAVILARRFIAALRGAGRHSLVPAIGVYVTVISAMSVGSIAAGSIPGIIGALLFMMSDSLIAEERFVRSRRWQPMTIIVTYHFALAGLVLGLA